MSHLKLTLNQIRKLLPLHEAEKPTLAFMSNPELLRLFATLERSILDAVRTEAQFEPGDIIFKENAPGDTMYLIAAGKVAVFKGDFDAPALMGYRGPGEFIGEMAVLESRPRSASVVALEFSRLLTINRQGFQEILIKAPQIGMGMMASLSARLRESDEVRSSEIEAERQLTHQVSRLKSEKEQLLELQRLRQETNDFIVHDLKNPLSIIKFGLDLLSITLPEPILTNNMQVFLPMQDAVDRLRRMVETLLDVEKLEAGESRLALTRAPLKTLFSEAKFRMEPALARHRLTMLIATAPDLPQIALDAEKIDRVLCNLIDNAIKYTPPGGVITLEATVAEGAMYISVTDTGPGIPVSERKRIFERFTQVEDSLGKWRGFGLGLTFCKLAVEAHGGRIWVESGPNGVGSRFIFTLPMAQESV